MQSAEQRGPETSLIILSHQHLLRHAPQRRFSHSASLPHGHPDRRTDTDGPAWHLSILHPLWDPEPVASLRLTLPPTPHPPPWAPMLGAGSTAVCPSFSPWRSRDPGSILALPQSKSICPTQVSAPDSQPHSASPSSALGLSGGEGLRNLCGNPGW